MTRGELLQVAKQILFNTDMVRAILYGRKTVTRRLPSKRIEEKYLNYEEWAGMVAPPGSTVLTEKQFYEQYLPYQTGDILYVRETWEEWTGGYLYKAWTDGIHQPGTFLDMPWRPSIHMPKEAARIFLRVTDVRVERLQDITWQQAADEGCYGSTSDEPDPLFHLPTLRGEFSKLWDSTIKKSDLDRYGWDANPWVWVIEFERVEPDV